MTTNYFTFGKGQVHSVANRTYDCDTIVKITSENPRQTMFDYFGNNWAFQYDSLEQMQPKKYWSQYKVVDVQKNEVVETYNKYLENE